MSAGRRRREAGGRQAEGPCKGFLPSPRPPLQAALAAAAAKIQRAAALALMPDAVESGSKIAAPAYGGVVTVDWPALPALGRSGARARWEAMAIDGSVAGSGDGILEALALSRESTVAMASAIFLGLLDSEAVAPPGGYMRPLPPMAEADVLRRVALAALIPVELDEHLGVISTTAGWGALWSLDGREWRVRTAAGAVLDGSGALTLAAAAYGVTVGTAAVCFVDVLAGSPLDPAAAETVAKVIDQVHSAARLNG